MILEEFLTTIVMLGFAIFLYYSHKTNPKGYKYYLGSPKFELGNWRKTVLIPVISIILLTLVITRIFDAELVSFNAPLLHQIIKTLLLAPIFEEITYRTLLLGMVCFPVINLSKRINKFVVYAAGTLLVSYIFTMMHPNPTNFYFALRFSGAMLYSFLYLWNDQNLLPPIVAHFTGNLLVFVVG